jgi:hypothetical protein
MKPIDVEFAAGGPAALWIWIWALAGSVCLGALIATGSILLRQNDRLAQVQDEIRALGEQQSRKAAPPPTSPAEAAEAAARHAALVTAARHLQTDLNPIFSVIERVDVPGAALARMAFETAGASGTAHAVRLEYLLDSVQKVPAVSAALNEGERVDWQLESAAATSGGVRAAWRYAGRDKEEHR